MDPQRFVGRLTPGLFPALLLLALGTLTLVFSMIVAGHRRGIDFGPPRTVVPLSAALLVLMTALHFVDCGVILAGPVWFFGLMLLFRLDYRDARALAEINWLMNCVWKLLFMLLSL